MYTFIGKDTSYKGARKKILRMMKQKNMQKYFFYFCIIKLVHFFQIFALKILIFLFQKHICLYM